MGLEFITKKWTGISWLLELDIEKGYDSIDQNIPKSSIERRMEDPGFMLLLDRLSEASLMEGERGRPNLNEGVP
jgi:hypothetical protein